MTNGFEIWKPSPREVSPVQPVVLSSREQQEAVFYATYSYLNAHTRHEVKGVLKEEGIKANIALRELLKQLATSLGRDKELQPQEWLWVGITDFIPDDLLHEWANPTETPHWTEGDFHLTARYFEQKKQP